MFAHLLADVESDEDGQAEEPAPAPADAAAPPVARGGRPGRRPGFAHSEITKVKISRGVVQRKMLEYSRM